MKNIYSNIYKPNLINLKKAKKNIENNNASVKKRRNSNSDYTCKITLYWYELILIKQGHRTPPRLFSLHNMVYLKTMQANTP